jgi:hypothetical protein
MKSLPVYSLFAAICSTLFLFIPVAVWLYKSGYYVSEDHHFQVALAVNAGATYLVMKNFFPKYLEYLPQSNKWVPKKFWPFLALSAILQTAQILLGLALSNTQ